MRWPEKIHEFRFRKPTPDDFHPTFPDGTCECHGFVWEPYNNVCYSKITVTGDTVNNLQLEHSGTLADTVAWYQEWSRVLSDVSIITKSQLHNYGFRYL